VGNLGRRLCEAFALFGFAAHLVGPRGGHMEGLGLAFHQDGEQELSMQLLATGAAADGLAALAGTLDEGAGKHLAYLLSSLRMRRLAVWCALPLVTLLAAAQEPGFRSLFDGQTLGGWKLVGGKGPGYVVEDGKLVCPADGGGNLYTDREYSDFILRFEFLMEPGGNNGVGIRSPLAGDAAYRGLEIQILDDQHERYKGWLKPEQHHGSVYGLIPARTGYLKPAGQWNDEEILLDGRRIRITLNGVIILDTSLDIVQEPQVLKKHPGLARASGHIGFLGHGTRVEFRNIRLRELR